MIYQHKNYIEYLDDMGHPHREDGPAIIHDNGTKEWFIHGLRHRIDGPAIEYSDGLKEWWFKGRTHREDGPAIIYSDGEVSWRLKGISYYTEQEYQNELVKIKLDRLKNL
jgi:hypothetical protein